uniref:Uncharacterized protein n=1 Tax=Setaria viridis TaxID=4556 RepID=A0A4U6W247_SETVI|nr:LOW QUALITY PROTEIN: hypothetical protein SEVIR_2G445000v2 [Setaria viridis]
MDTPMQTRCRAAIGAGPSVSEREELVVPPGRCVTMHCNCLFLAEPATLQDWWAHIRRLQPRGSRKGLDSLFVLQLWKERSARLFERQMSSVQERIQGIKQEAQLWVEAGACRLGCLRCE